MLKRLLCSAFIVFSATLSAQPAVRRATNIAGLIGYPGFYHSRQVLIVGKVTLTADGEFRVSDDAGSVTLISKGNTPEGTDEVRGEFWDVGRMQPGDPRLAEYDVKKTFHIDPDGPWPRAGQVLAIIATAVAPAPQPAAPSIRNMVLYPDRYLDQKITLTGQFGGRNLLGDLPDSPGKSKYDFVVRTADAAIWVINLRPRGKDFELALDTRIDTGRWVEVSGMVQQGRGLQWLDATGSSVKLTTAPVETRVEEPEIHVPAAPPPEAVFSAPTQDESDVQLTTNVRIQFSRDLDPATIRGNLRVSYLQSETLDRGEPETPKIEFTTQYNAGNRVLEIRFGGPLERFRTVKIELLDSILGTDKQALKPWTLTFATGG
jgi:hypothetical protein